MPLRHCVKAVSGYLKFSKPRHSKRLILLVNLCKSRFVLMVQKNAKNRKDLQNRRCLAWMRWEAKAEGDPG
jgi:hypothetical protein